MTSERKLHRWHANEIKTLSPNPTRRLSVDELCAKAASRMIVDRLYPEEDDSAFNEITGTSSKDFFAGIKELAKTQTKFNTETTKISDELEELSKNFNSASLNEMSFDNQNKANQNTSSNRGNYRGN